MDGPALQPRKMDGPALQPRVTFGPALHLEAVEAELKRRAVVGN